MRILGMIGRACGLQTMICTAIFAAGLATITAHAQKLNTLVNFDGSNGAFPLASLSIAPNGNLLSTTLGGGSEGNGTVFEIAKSGHQYAAKATVLYNAVDTYGSNPEGALIADANGNLFGTGLYGGTSGLGTVFEIAKTTTGYTAKPSVLMSFDGSNGASPVCALILDKNGNLLGTATAGGQFGQGVVFEIAKTSTGYASTPTVLVSFNGSNGATPASTLLADANGNLFGTTFQGGAFGAGTVFEIAKTADGYASTPNVLFNFDYSNGSEPQTALIADASGNLFGTALGGGAFGNGVVYELAKTADGYASTPNVLIDFDGANGATPLGALLIDASGSLFGTAQSGGAFGQGTVYKIAKTVDGYSSAPSILVNFNKIDGATPSSSLTADPDGKLLGTTQFGGKADNGTVFEISNTGFVAPVKFAGTPGALDCSTVSDSALIQTYGDLSLAAKDLGYSSDAELRKAIDGWCGIK
jgi:uncharacterized repeat protein (TIGR03803 family)